MARSMDWGKALACALLLLQGVACLAYFSQRDWRHGLYWLFAVGITYVVTFLL